MLLESKVAVVSGVGPGMGYEMAHAFAREGADVVIAARSLETMESMAKQIEVDTGRRALPLQMDLMNEQSRERLTDAVAGEFGHIDILVNNAAHPGNYKTLMATRLDSWRKTMEMNVFGTLGLTQLMVPLMAGRDGRIIMISTVSARDASPASAAYGGSKAGLGHIARILAKELGPQGIRVNTILPGAIMGEHWRTWAATQAEARGITYDQFVEEAAATHALRYIPDAKQIAGTAVFLASDLSRPITGQSIVVDGG